MDGEPAMELIRRRLCRWRAEAGPTADQVDLIELKEVLAARSTKQS